MSKQREALEMALSTLSGFNGLDTDNIISMTIWVNDEIELIEKALAELDVTESGFGNIAKPLTDEELDALRQPNHNFVTLREFRQIARAVEKKIRGEV